jgi:hypothetical protein
MKNLYAHIVNSWLWYQVWKYNKKHQAEMKRINEFNYALQKQIIGK